MSYSVLHIPSMERIRAGKNTRLGKVRISFNELIETDGREKCDWRRVFQAPQQQTEMRAQP
ncbi:hypothetical protein ACU8KH_05676 [Lachancea thermotolerans]